jgi:Trypsin-like peptidase domain
VLWQVALAEAVRAAGYRAEVPEDSLETYGIVWDQELQEDGSPAAVPKLAAVFLSRSVRGRRTLGQVTLPGTDVSAPVIVEEYTRAEHVAAAPTGGVTTCIARSDSWDRAGIVTAGHVLGDGNDRAQVVSGSFVELRKANAQPVLREVLCIERGVMDIAVVAVDPEELGELVELSIMRYIPAGEKVTVISGNRTLENRILFVHEPPAGIPSAVRGKKPTLSDAVFLQQSLSHGDSGALVISKNGEAIALYLGALQTYDDKPLGQCLSLRQPSVVYSLRLFREVEIS